MHCERGVKTPLIHYKPADRCGVSLYEKKHAIFAEMGDSAAFLATFYEDVMFNARTMTSNAQADRRLGADVKALLALNIGGRLIHTRFCQVQRTK
ncbi:hypothetical protein OAL64_00375 [bacterium]|nr:hypothetical protein [bacterium]